MQIGAAAFLAGTLSLLQVSGYADKSAFVEAEWQLLWFKLHLVGIILRYWSVTDYCVSLWL